MKRSGYDRRDETDRRVAYSVNYFENGGLDRRREERRRSRETRIGWIRTSPWSSIYVGDYVFLGEAV
ncbi:MAG: hypothetical protein KAK02_03105 [Desulfobulbaceae bacterium]|nr:hypothetical protein [Desulfobulbaceae bacterium]